MNDSRLRCIHSVPSGHGCPQCRNVVPTLLDRRPWWSPFWRIALEIAEGWLLFAMPPVFWFVFTVMFNVSWRYAHWVAMLQMALWGVAYVTTRRVKGR